MQLSEQLGKATGWLLAPWTALGSSLRGARVFHPTGLVFRARVQSLSPAGPAQAVAARLSGEAMVRLSSALWKKEHTWPDVLGCAIRFWGAEPPSAQPSPGDQDLLFATIRHPWTLAVAPFSTKTDDYLANDYYGVSPFMIPELGKVHLRLKAPQGTFPGESRSERLRAAVAQGQAFFALQYCSSKHNGLWTPLCTISLQELMQVDQRKLRFWPYQNDRGIFPTGFVHGLRSASYYASQKARHSMRP